MLKELLLFFFGLELLWLFFVSYIMPYKQRRAYYTQLLDSLGILTQMVLLQILVYDPSFELLLAATVIPVLLSLIAEFVLPAMATLLNGEPAELAFSSNLTNTGQPLQTSPLLTPPSTGSFQ